MLQRRQAHGRRSSIFNQRERELQAKAKAEREEKLALAARMRLNKVQQQTEAPSGVVATPTAEPNRVLNVGNAKQRNKRAPAWVIWAVAAVAVGLVVLKAVMG